MSAATARTPCRCSGVSVCRTASAAACVRSGTAGGAGADVGQADFVTALIELQVDGLDPPGFIDAEQPGVVGVQRFHARTLRNGLRPAVMCHGIPGRTTSLGERRRQHHA